MKVGITGQAGFIGKHLYNTLGLFPETYTRVAFEKEFFNDENLLDAFVKQCDIIVHLAAVNRHAEPSKIYSTNVELAQKLRDSLIRTNAKPHVIFSSSTQEERDNPYGNAKKEAREMLSSWASESNSKFTGLIIPNVFGPFGNPYYNSVVATFCYELLNNRKPIIENDNEIELLYVGDLMDEFVKIIKNTINETRYIIASNKLIYVSEILSILNEFKIVYFNNGEIPLLKSKFELQLFNTFRSFIDLKKNFPIILNKNSDERGVFVEIVRHGVSGQTSYSVTLPNITRGNHFHTRKIERFAVIKGKAIIQLRRIGDDEIISFELNGEKPAYVDIPVWYSHKIKNIGEEDLLTIFWINEPFNSSDPDTYFEIV